MEDLRMKLRAKGITPRQLAKAVGVTEDYIHRILSHKQKPSGDIMMRITHASRGAIRWSDIFTPINKKSRQSDPAA